MEIRKFLQLLYQFILCTLIGIYIILFLSYGSFPSIKIGFSLDIPGFLRVNNKWTGNYVLLAIIAISASSEMGGSFRTPETIGAKCQINLLNVWVSLNVDELNF